MVGHLLLILALSLGTSTATNSTAGEPTGLIGMGENGTDSTLGFAIENGDLNKICRERCQEVKESSNVFGRWIGLKCPHDGPDPTVEDEKARACSHDIEHCGFCENKGFEISSYSTGGIVAIVILVLLVLAVIGYFCYRKHSQKNQGMHRGEEVA